MSVMCDIYNTLKNLQYFIDNEYLEKYSQLITRHYTTPQRSKQTHKHHILPRSWFKLTNLEVNDCLNNLVNLPVREHFLAHYYLCLCTEDPFKYANQLALSCLLAKTKISTFDKLLLQRLPMYNYIYEDYKKKLKSNYKLYD